MVRRSLTAVFAAVLLAPSAPSAQAAPTIAHGVHRSFDGTPIAYTLFLPETAPAPVVFMTHGWGQRRATTPTGMVATLLSEGYAVLTWDQRGFGDSGGVAQVDSQDYEVRDVQGLIDLAAANEAVELDGPGDPRMGMVGPSYAGGIQLMVASADPRVDAIVPQITWNDLPQALRPGGVLKMGWDLLLYGSGFATGTAEGLDSPAGPQSGAYADEIHTSLVEGLAFNDWSAETLAWYDARSPKHYIRGGNGLPGIHAATLLVQATNDTLFPINHAIASYEAVRANGAPAKMIFFCGLLVSTHASHSLRARSSCPDGDQGPVVTDAVRTWFRRHLRGDDTADTGAPIDYQRQDGTWGQIAALPAVGTSGDVCPPGVLDARCNGEVVMLAGPEPSGGSHVAATPSLGGHRFPLRGNLAGRTLLGVPVASGGINGVGEDATLFFRLIDVAPDGTETVIDDQVSAWRAGRALGSSAPIDFRVEMNGVAWKVEPGHRVFAEISTGSHDHAASRVPFVALVNASVSVPVV